MIRVVIDYGEDLPNDYSMVLSTCSLSSSANQLEIVENGTVSSPLQGLLKQTEAISDRKVELEWHVFQLGHDPSIRFSCDLKIVKTVVVPPAVLVLNTLNRKMFIKLTFFRNSHFDQLCRK